MNKIPTELRAIMDLGRPSVVISCSKDGLPNSTMISQIYYVNETQVALPFQFFNKTARNVKENPQTSISMIDFSGNYTMQTVFDHSENTGDIFEKMDMQIEAIASATGMAGIFKLQSAEIYNVNSIRKIPLGE